MLLAFMLPLHYRRLRYAIYHDVNHPEDAAGCRCHD